MMTLANSRRIMVGCGDLKKGKEDGDFGEEGIFRGGS